MRFFPRSIKIFKRHSIYVKILLFFNLLVILSILIVGYYSYSYYSKKLIEEVQNSNALLLNQARDNIDIHIQALDKLTLQISNNQLISKAYYIPKEFSAHDIFLFRDIILYLSNIEIPNDIIANISIHLLRSDTVISNYGKYSTELYFNYVSIFDDNFYYQLKENQDKFTPFRSLGRHRVFQNDGVKQYISFSRSIPINTGKPNAYILLNVDVDYLERMLARYDDETSMSAFVLDQDNNVLFGYSNIEHVAMGSMIDEFRGKEIFLNPEEDKPFYDVKINEKNYTVSKVVSTYNGWTYLSFIPTAHITQNVSIIKNMTLLIMSISFVISLLLSYVLAGKIYHPISKVIDYLNIISIKDGNKKLIKSKDELYFINDIINLIYKENEKFRVIFDKNLPELKQKFINDLMEGIYTSNQMKEVAKSIDLEMPFKIYQAIVLESEDTNNHSIRWPDKWNVEATKELNRLSKKVPSSEIKIFYSIRSFYKKINILVNMSSSDENASLILDFLQDVIISLGNVYKSGFTAGVGKPCKNAEEIKSSYIEALYSLKYKIIKGHNAIIHLDEVGDTPQNVIDYSFEKEKQMINYIKSGDYTEAKKNIEEIIFNNLTKSEVSPEMVHYLYNVLVGSAIRTIYEINQSVKSIAGENYDIYNAISQYNVLEEKTDCLLEFIKKITDFIGERKQNKYHEIYQEIIQYMTENYFNDISLNDLSDRMTLSPSYISLIFKEASGENFIEYLNRLRIEKAKNFLKDQKYTVTQIANLVGYNNSHTFIRVFKKFEGVTPGRYRDGIK